MLCCALLCLIRLSSAWRAPTVAYSRSPRLRAARFFTHVAITSFIREFKDVVCEDVVFDNDSLGTFKIEGTTFRNNESCELATPSRIGGSHAAIASEAHISRKRKGNASLRSSVRMLL